ncbi:STAS domain-containing protein [Massilia endophytica]|uniref:STAS domain-containing protein n=1 Tax=Massilia endophytica TaxID=2899220 RepID=UPI001E590AD2|nr:STAS domain-containing protein [Massilia endophytica]UGQ45170.1 STAS domain-containing protein [Massilia endophytica]
MSIGEESQGARSALAIEGELTIYRAAELKPVLLEAAAGGALALDLSQVTEFDSAGLQLLLMAQRQATLQLLAPSDAVCEVLALLDMTSQFTILEGATA